MSASKLLRILYIVGSLLFLAMFLVAKFSLKTMQAEMNRKKTESARRNRWREREPEPEPEPDNVVKLEPETNGNEERETVA